MRGLEGGEGGGGGVNSDSMVKSSVEVMLNCGYVGILTINLMSVTAKTTPTVIFMRA